LKAALPPDAQRAQAARTALGDFAPALLLLPGTERSRARALIAYASQVLACAEQPGLAADRLSAIDRWEASRASGSPSPGGTAGGGDGGNSVATAPDVCARMAWENARRRWPPDALDELAACARSLARAVAGALLEGRLNSEVNGLAGALIRLVSLQGLGAALAAGRCPLAEDEVRHPGGGDPRDLIEAVRRECARLRPRLLRSPRGLVDLPVPYQRAGVFALLAGLRLLSELEEAGAGLLTAPPHLGKAARLALLARARWIGLHARLR
jgi:hypothetical protein